jgi:hypothetical protein
MAPRLAGVVPELTKVVLGFFAPAHPAKQHAARATSTPAVAHTPRAGQALSLRLSTTARV